MIIAFSAGLLAANAGVCGCGRRWPDGRIPVLACLMREQRPAADQHTGAVTATSAGDPPLCRHKPRCVEPERGRLCARGSSAGSNDRVTRWPLGRYSPRGCLVMDAFAGLSAALLTTAQW